MSVVAAAAGGGAGGAKRKLIEETVEGEGDDKVLLVELEGVIASGQGGGLFAVPSDPVESIKRQLEQAEKDEQVKAVLLLIDSPGGAVTPSDEIHHEVTGFRSRSHKPVVVLMGSVCASGGVYVAVAADKIVCQPTTITGSIGVILSSLNFHDLLTKYGVQDVTIASGPNKALLNPTSPVRDEHRAILQNMIDDAYARFVKLVAEGRGLDEETVRGFADGRIYTPPEALRLKLVDQIGYREDALALARSLGSCPQSRLVQYRRQPTLADVLSGNARGPLSLAERLDPAALIDELRAPRLLALWRPH
jgi:protease-4